MSKEDKINITFETLYDLLTKEKKKGELQELPEEFFDDLLSYLKSKQDMFEKFKTDDLIFSIDRQKKLKELTNIKGIVQDLLIKRIQKITDLASLSVRTGKDIVSDKPLLEEEKVLAKEMRDILSIYKKQVIDKINSFKKPDLKQEFAKERSSEKSKKQDKDEELVLLRFKSPVPQFLDEKGEVVGPFREEDIASLPREIASILIKKGRAEEMKEKR
jgi:DNA replication initiation complex subunit (GINS family)